MIISHNVILPEPKWWEQITLGNIPKLQKLSRKKFIIIIQKVILSNAYAYVYDGYRLFQFLMNKLLVFGGVDNEPRRTKDNAKAELCADSCQYSNTIFWKIERRKFTFHNSHRQKSIREHIVSLFRNVENRRISPFRITSKWGSYVGGKWRYGNANFFGRSEAEIDGAKDRSCSSNRIKKDLQQVDASNSLFGAMDLKMDSIFFSEAVPSMNRFLPD